MELSLTIGAADDALIIILFWAQDSSRAHSAWRSLEEEAGLSQEFQYNGIGGEAMCYATDSHVVLGLRGVG